MNDDKVIALFGNRRDLEPPREVMCQISVYDNGDVTVWMSDDMYTKDQFNWLFAKLAKASGAVFGEKMDRTGSE